jgi:hypothetical protein
VRKWPLSFVLLVGCADGSFPERPAQPPPVPPGAGFPCIRSLSPSRGLVGTDITLTGEFGDHKMAVTFSAEGSSTRAIVRSWSPTQVVVSAPDISWGRWSVTLPGGCQLTPAPVFQAIPPARVYINNNANDADGFNTVTAMAFDLDTGALTPTGKPRSIGLPASRHAGCSSAQLVGVGLYASGDTGVASLDIDPATGALLPTLSDSPVLSGSTGGTAVHSVGAFVWTATDDGVVVWRRGPGGSLVDRRLLSTSSARDLMLFGSIRPFKLYATRGDNTFDAWSVSYQPLEAGGFPSPVLTPLDGSPFGTPVASPAGGITYMNMPDGDMLYVPSAEGLRVWSAGGSSPVTELAGSPFALNPPDGTLSRPLLIGRGRTRTIYMAGVGTGYIVAATLDEAGTPTQVPGSPWNFAPSVTNLSCMIATSSPSGAVRLIATDAGNRRIAVFDLPAGSAAPVPVPGSPFVMADTPSELASGIAVLQPTP